jgi:hypothetical protein
MQCPSLLTARDFPVGPMLGGTSDRMAKDG